MSRWSFLGNVSGVIHVGASSGQERRIYDSFGIDVLWIEPIPDVFERLQKNVQSFPKQRAVNALVTDCDGREYEFHISSNEGHSSSILEIAQHADIWPEVRHTETIRLEGKTLTTLVADERLDPTGYQALVMDTQGSELLVLQGAVRLLRYITHIKTEVADFEAYKDCCQLADIEEFMQRHGYREVWRHRFAKRRGGGSYYNVLYSNLADAAMNGN